MTTEEAIEYLIRCADGLDPDFEGAVSMAISALQSQQNGGWISVDERLPPTNTAVLAIIRNAKTDRWFTFALLCINFDGEWNYFGGPGIDYCHNVTHWQPLPEPPMIGE